MWAALVAQVATLVSDGESLAWAESAPLADLCAGHSWEPEPMAAELAAFVAAAVRGPVTARS